MRANVCFGRAVITQMLYSPSKLPSKRGRTTDLRLGSYSLLLSILVKFGVPVKFISVLKSLHEHVYKKALSAPLSTEYHQLNFFSVWVYQLSTYSLPAAYCDGWVMSHVWVLIPCHGKFVLSLVRSMRPYGLPRL